jgi:hypothetical protein
MASEVSPLKNKWEMHFSMNHNNSHGAIGYENYSIMGVRAFLNTSSDVVREFHFNALKFRIIDIKLLGHRAQCAKYIRTIHYTEIYS